MDKNVCKVDKELDRLFDDQAWSKHHSDKDSVYSSYAMANGSLIKRCKGCNGALDIEGSYCSWCIFDGAS